MSDDYNPGREPWHISRAVSVTHILSTLVIIGSLFVYLSDQNSRISSNQLNIQHLQRNLSDDRQAAEKRYDDFRTDLQIINKKLDRLIQYSSRNDDR